MLPFPLGVGEPEIDPLDLAVPDRLQNRACVIRHENRPFASENPDGSVIQGRARAVQRRVNISRGQGQKERRWAAISILSSIATGRGTPTLPSSQRLTAGRLTPIALARSDWVR